MRVALVDDSLSDDWTDAPHIFEVLAAPLRASGHEVIMVNAADCGPTRLMTGLSRERDARPLLASARVAANLIGSPVDVCLFPDHRGLAHCTLMARACGELPASTRIIAWQMQEDRTTGGSWANDGLSGVVASAMRRFCRAQFDALVTEAVSGHPALRATFVLYPEGATREFVFVGALTRRNGLVEFVEAMEALARAGKLGGKTVSLVGAFGEGQGGVDREWIGRRAAAWPFRFRVKETRSLAEALRFATKSGVLGVIANASCDFVFHLSELKRSRIRAQPLFPGQSFNTSLVTMDAGNTWCFDPMSVWTLVAPHLGEPRKYVARDDVAPKASVALSFCILHYERPQLLEQAVESVLSQADCGVTVEIIVVDNASASDAAKESLGRVGARQGVRVVTSSDPLPYSSALNRAAERALHPWLVFLDDDNLLAPGGLARLGLACGEGHFDVVTSTLEIIEDDPADCVGLMTFIGPAYTAGLFFNGFGDNCMVFRRSEFLRIGGYLHRDAPYPCADWVLLCRAQAAGLRIGVLQQPAFRYRRNLRKTSLHWQSYDQQSVRELVLCHFGGCYDAREVAQVSQAMALELAV